MTSQQHKKNIPFDEKNYQLVEYEDFFYTENKKKIRVQNLGFKFAAINSFFCEYLKEFNIPCTYIKKIGKKSILHLKSSRFPFTVKVINCADKRISKIFSIKPGTNLSLPVIEYHHGDSQDSLICESHLISFNLCSYDDFKFINRICSKLNAVIKSFFERRSEIFIEMICKFGKHGDKILLTEGFTPLSLKILRLKEGEKFPDPYKLDTASLMRRYTDHLHNFTSR
jgi:phosphoribosylaminoimidazole-succinocarboxamide synthase